MTAFLFKDGAPSREMIVPGRPPRSIVWPDPDGATRYLLYREYADCALYFSEDSPTWEKQSREVAHAAS